MRLYTHVEPRKDRRDGSANWGRPTPKMTVKGKQS